MPSYSFEGIRPVVHESAYVHPLTVLIGDVVIGAGSYIGPSASLRGDFGRIVVGSGANVQDNCTVHSFPGRVVSIADEGHIGHGAILHGCRIERNALVGMNAVVMDDAIVGEDCIIGALAFVRAGSIAPPGTMWAGAPARELRAVSDTERAWKRRGTQVYQDLVRRCLGSLTPCDPLSQEEVGRQRLSGDFVPLPEWRARDGG